MDPFTVAAGLVGMLAPVLQTLGGSVGDRIAKAAGEAIGDTALRGARALWGRIAPSLQRQPDASRALDDLRSNPDLTNARTVLIGRIGMLLDADPRLLRDAVAVIDARDRHVASTNRVRGDHNVIISGDGNIGISASNGITIHRGALP